MNRFRWAPKPTKELEAVQRQVEESNMELDRTKSALREALQQWHETGHALASILEDLGRVDEHVGRLGDDLAGKTTKGD